MDPCSAALFRVQAGAPFLVFLLPRSGFLWPFRVCFSLETLSRGKRVSSFLFFFLLPSRARRFVRTRRTCVVGILGPCLLPFYYDNLSTTNYFMIIAFPLLYSRPLIGPPSSRSPFLRANVPFAHPFYKVGLFYGLRSNLTVHL